MKERERERVMERKMERRRTWRGDVEFLGSTDLGYLEYRSLPTLLVMVNIFQSPESLVLGIFPPLFQQDCGVGFSDKHPPVVREGSSRVHRPLVFVLLRSKDRISSLRVFDVRPEEYSAIILGLFGCEAQVEPDTIRVYLQDVPEEPARAS